MALPHLEPRHRSGRFVRCIGQVDAIRLRWQPVDHATAYEVHGVELASTSWQPTPATLLGVVDVARFAHRGLGPLARRWSYQVVPRGVVGVRLDPVLAESLTSVTVTGKPIATVGSYDGSGLELALAPTGFVHYRSTFPRDVDFRHGLDRADVRWSYLQPGPDDAWAGRRGHRFRLRFDLDILPADDVDLALWLVDRHPTRAGSASLLVNGHQVDTVYFDEPGTVATAPGPPGTGAGPAYVERPVGRQWLQLGENTLDVVKDHGSWIAYDALGIFARS